MRQILISEKYLSEYAYELLYKERIAKKYGWTLYEIDKTDANELDYILEMGDISKDE